MIFLLIITTNLIDRNNFLRVKDSVIAIYEDRLVVKGLIFEISSRIHQKELAIVEADSSFYKQSNPIVNKAIEEYINEYEQTQLTIDERNIFNDFKADFQLLKSLESVYVNSDWNNSAALLEQISAIKENLHKLSKIQLVEGRRQLNISQRAIDTVELFTQIEIYVLIFLAILIQIIVIYNPKE